MDKEDNTSFPNDKDTINSTFLHVTQINNFKKCNENLDNISASSISRRSIAMNYFYSDRYMDDVSKGYLLENDLKEYSQIVDNKTGLNNYSAFLDVLPRNTSTNQRWTSRFDTSKDITHFLKNRGCDCFSSVPKERDLSLLFTPIAKSDKTVVDSKSIRNSAFEPKENYAKEHGKSYDSSNISNGNTNENNLSEFRTAYSQLRLQNKNAHDKYDDKNAVQNGNIAKRTLGFPSRTVNSKFVPPIKNVEPIKQEIRNNGEDEEQLKHIDPKLVEMVKTEIMDSKNDLKWEDIAGLEYAKAAIQEIVVWPMLRPDLFTGLRQPPRGILLFGPPGTGKTLIGRCVASQAKATFFSISASSITSKYVGEGEKMVKALFAVSRCYQPSIIFIDEIDSLLSQRSDTEHESSRRIKTEFLVQLDGVATGQEDRIVIMGATNRPQELDGAALRRLVKRLYIPLPDHNARYQMISLKLGTMENNLTEDEMNEIASLTDGYSGADIKNLCTEASLEPIRCIDMSLIQTIDCTQVRPISLNDFKKALRHVRASVPPSDLEQYFAWNEKYGSTTR